MRKYISLLLGIVIGIYLISLTAGAVASQAGKDYAAADTNLNRVYQQLVSQINNSSHRQRLKTAQQAWIKLRDADVNFYGHYYINSKGGLFLKTKLTGDRTTYLKSILDRPLQGDNNDFGPVE